jgi:hypothetical protein
MSNRSVTPDHITTDVAWRIQSLPAEVGSALLEEGTHPLLHILRAHGSLHGPALLG